jgi:hypothetical protein
LAMAFDDSASSPLLSLATLPATVGSLSGLAMAAVVWLSTLAPTAAAGINAIAAHTSAKRLWRRERKLFVIPCPYTIPRGAGSPEAYRQVVKST